MFTELICMEYLSFFSQQPPSQAQPYAPQGWANAYQPWQGQAAPAADPSKSWYYL